MVSSVYRKFVVVDIRKLWMAFAEVIRDEAGRGEAGQGGVSKRLYIKKRVMGTLAYSEKQRKECKQGGKKSKNRDFNKSRSTVPRH